MLVNTIKPIAQGYDQVIAYLPQRKPFVMVDTLWINEESKTVTSLDVLPTNVLVENDYLTESAMLENMAQTAAMRVGHAFKSQGLEVPVGFITAIKDYKVHSFAKVGESIYTEVVQTNEVMNFTIVQAVVKLNHEVIAEAEVRVFINK